VILAVPAPWPLDAVLAWPLVLLDRWVGSGRAPDTAEQPDAVVQLLALTIGILLTWLFYILLARVVLWRIVTTRHSNRIP
jgi:hypothetical protein